METKRDVSIDALLPEQLGKLWQSVEAGQLTTEAFEAEQARLLDDYRKTWTRALMLEGQPDLKTSLLSEVSHYTACQDLAEVERRCRQGGAVVKREWETTFRPGSLETVQHFYDGSEGYLYELMWWHNLLEDHAPLAYVLALRFASAQGCHHHLDFGGGAGAGAILFARNGYETTWADISSTLLRFAQWRIQLRQLPARFLDLKTDTLPAEAYDVVTAMDVFEHLVDPVQSVQEIWQALKPGGFLIGRFGAGLDHDHPQHIVRSFGPMFRRLKELGCVEVWRDEWIWGHQVFRKS